MRPSFWENFKGSLARFISAGCLFVLSYILNRFSPRFPEEFLTFWRRATLIFFDFVSRALSVFPFSLAEVALYCLAISAVIGLITAIASAIFYTEAGSLLSYFSHLTLTAANLLFAYYLLFGMWGFAESPIMPPLERVTPTAELVYETALDMQERANTLASRIPRNDDKTANLKSFAKLGDRVAAAFKDKVAPLGVTDVAPPKKLLWTKALSHCGITGIFVPYTSEVHVNADMPSVYIPFTMAHELAHRYGTNAEDYCNYIAYDLLIGREDELAYSAALSAYNYLSNALYLTDPALWMEFKEGESELLAADIREGAFYWKAFEGPVQSAARKVNDLHIKIDGDPDGERSYERIVGLLVSRYVSKNQVRLGE